MTGAAMGIGKAVAIHYIDKGWHVGVTDINATALETFKKEYGDQIAYAAIMDVTNETQVTKVIDDFAQTADGKIDFFSNNAGVGWGDLFTEQPLSNHPQTIDIHSKGIATCAYRAFPYLKNAVGTLVNMCSQSANYGVPYGTTDAASKFFVRGFTEGLNIEWQKFGVYVCAIWPNFVERPMVGNIADHPGPVLERIGVRLTVKDVVKTIEKAIVLKKMHLAHWHVDTLFWKMSALMSSILPHAVSRYFMKSMARL